ncbi:MAG: COG4280 domain-containing protein [Acetobacteraceae bacterium]
MPDWTVAVPAFLAAGVEWVEAFTIVLAVSLSIGWRGATGAALTALVALVAMTAITGGALSLGVGLSWLQLLIGVFLLLFGVRWLAKAVARAAGWKKLHDEGAEFAETRARLSTADWYAGWTIAFKGVLLEGLEVWLIVVALGLHGGAWASSAGAAIAALVVVAAAGAAVRAPLRRVPENAIKFAVGVMIVSFGTYWTIEALGGAAAWPLGDWSLLVLVLFYAGGGLLVASLSRRPGRTARAR